MAGDGFSLVDLRILIRGAGEMASGTAVVLRRAGISRVVMTEVALPKAVRRRVSFSEAVFVGQASVAGFRARKIDSPCEIQAAWNRGEIALIVDPAMESVREIDPEVVIDATLRKRASHFRRDFAPMTIGFGPGFTAGGDVDLVVETQRGNNLGRVIEAGEARPDTGIPAPVFGHAADRVIKARRAGLFLTSLDIGEHVRKGEPIGRVVSEESGPPEIVEAAIEGRIRGLLRDGSIVAQGEKLGDIDPKGNDAQLDEISDKAERIGRGALEAIERLMKR